MKTSNILFLILCLLSLTLWFVDDITVILIFVFLILPIGLTYLIIRSIEKNKEERETKK